MSDFLRYYSDENKYGSELLTGLLAMGSSVRSFDNTRSETIQFHTPLTLIVGYNGSGKTV